MAGLEKWSETMDATETTQKMIWIYIIFCFMHTQVKPLVEKETGHNYGEYTALKYRSESVFQSFLFLLQVLVGGDDCIHLMVWIALCQPPELKGVEQHKTREDPLHIFRN
uniref:Uncharacterized protein n=1 Tax=Sander lucioperca TaxID=283035 RepID=A0A8D0A6G3_SANLU